MLELLKKGGCDVNHGGSGGTMMVLTGYDGQTTLNMNQEREMNADTSHIMQPLIYISKTIRMK